MNKREEIELLTEEELSQVTGGTDQSLSPHRE